MSIRCKKKCLVTFPGRSLVDFRGQFDILSNNAIKAQLYSAETTACKSLQLYTLQHLNYNRVSLQKIAFFFFFMTQHLGLVSVRFRIQQRIDMFSDRQLDKSNH